MTKELFDFEKDCEEGFKLGIKRFEELHEGDLLLNKEKLIEKIKMKCDFGYLLFILLALYAQKTNINNQKKTTKQSLILDLHIQI